MFKVQDWVVLSESGEAKFGGEEEYHVGYIIKATMDDTYVIAPIYIDSLVDMFTGRELVVKEEDIELIDMREVEVVLC